MDYVRLGNSGLHVTPICLGMNTFGDPNVMDWALDIDGAEPLVKRAVELGVNFFDTADVYSAGASEVITGQLLRKFFNRREDYVVATKVCQAMGNGPYDRGLSRRHILSSVDASLFRLGLDYIDLYQIHRWDPTTPIEETMQTLDDLIRAGKVRYIGASSMWAWQFSKAQYTAVLNGWTRFVTMQNHYNLLYREEEREMLPLLVDQGVSSFPWSPLARGLLARADDSAGSPTFRSTADPLVKERYVNANREILRTVASVATANGVPPAQVAIAWLLQQPSVTAATVGVTKTSHIEDAVAAIDVRLSDGEIARLGKEYLPQPVMGHE